MKAFTAYLTGWKTALQHWRMWLGLYLITLLFALLAALPLRGFLSKTVGQSLAFSRSFEGFDYTFLRDFLREYGQGFGAIMNQAVGYTILYLLFSVLLMGAILSVIGQRERAFRWVDFWQGGLRFFWRMLRLAVYFLLLHGLVLAFFGFLFYRATKGFAPFELESEAPILRAIRLFLPLYLLLAILVFMLHDYAKIHAVQVGRRWLFRPTLRAIRLVFRHFGKIALLYLLNVATFALLMVFYWWLSESLNSGAYFGMFLLGQGLAAGRVGLKLVNLGSATWLYQQLLNVHRWPLP